MGLPQKTGYIPSAAQKNAQKNTRTSELVVDAERKEKKAKATMANDEAYNKAMQAIIDAQFDFKKDPNQKKTTADSLKADAKSRALKKAFNMGN